MKLLSGASIVDICFGAILRSVKFDLSIAMFAIHSMPNFTLSLHL